MVYIIQTIGQRDMQIHYKTEESDYSSFDKKELKQVQSKLSELFKKNDLKWKKISGKEGRQNRTANELEDSSKEVCFPLTEKIIQSLSKDNEYCFILLYTDRQKSGSDKAYINNEPWIFSKIIKNFWEKITDSYRLKAKLMTLNICQEMETNWDIDVDFAYYRMDKIAQQLITSNKISSKDKIQIYNSGGMPKISEALDLSFNAYFPKQVTFMEQNFGIISKSKQHILQKNYSLKFSILQKLKQFDFSSAYKDANELQLSKLNNSLWKIISICKNWLYDENKISEKNKYKVLKNKNNETFYITTTLPYVNGKPHMGHALEFIRADILARHKRLVLGKENVFFNTGTDEHGQKIADMAKKENISAQEYVDNMAEEFKKVLDINAMNISNDKFIRTTDKKHKKSAQKF